jgi:KTSC domain
MVLKKEVHEDIIKCTFDSSNVIASEFNQKTQDLIITFKAGTRYKYANVSATDYMRFEIAESQGKVFNSHIKKYPTEKVDIVNVVNILKESEMLMQEEKRVLEEMRRAPIITTATKLIALDKDMAVPNSKTVFIENLKKLEEAIKQYLEVVN